MARGLGRDKRPCGCRGADAEVLVDPMNGGAFVYRRTGDNFILYSKGLNGIDEGGKREEVVFTDGRKVLNEGCDDYVIWPNKGKTPQQQEQKANE
jgi:hypothetical protein